MNIPPQESTYRRQWERYNRPFNGCGYVYIVLTILVICALVGLVLQPAGGWL
jgi:hypothetical protein